MVDLAGIGWDVGWSRLVGLIPQITIPRRFGKTFRTNRRWPRALQAVRPHNRPRLREREVVILLAIIGLGGRIVTTLRWAPALRPVVEISPSVGISHTLPHTPRERV